MDWRTFDLIVRHASKGAIATGTGAPKSTQSMQRCFTAGSLVSATKDGPSTLDAMKHLGPVGPRADLVVEYAARHGDIVAVVSARGMLLVRRNDCPAWSEGVRVTVIAGEPVGVVEEKLAEAHRVAVLALTSRRPRRAAQG